MKLRFRILEPTNSGAPDYNICGQAASSIDFNNLALTLLVNGVVIWNTNDLGSYSFPNTTFNLPNNITVTDIGILNSEYLVLAINGVSPISGAKVTLVINKTGYFGYSQVFDIYNYDLGNNPNETNSNGDPINYNPAFNIYLINQTNNIINSVQTKAYSSIIAYQKPFTNSIHFYKADSSAGTIRWYDENNELILIGRDGMYCCNCNTNLYTIKQNTTLYTSCNNILSVCETTKEVVLKNYKPDINITANCVSCCTDCCTTPEDTIESYVHVSFSGEPHYMNDVIVYNTINTLSLTGTLNTINGVIENNTPFEITLSNTSESFLLASYNISAPGDAILCIEADAYYIYEEQNSYKIYTCNKCITVKLCDIFEIKQVNCSSYIVYNNSVDTVTIQVNKLDENGEFVLENETIIEPFSNIIVEHDTDGIYNYVLTRGETQRHYVIHVYCKLQECLLKHINNLICCKPKNKCKGEDYYDFNQIIITAHTYFNLLNIEYNYANIFESLTPNKIKELFDIKVIMDRIVAYCTDCEEPCEDCAKQNCNGCS